VVVKLVQLNDFQRQWEDIRDDALAAIKAVGRSGSYILGREVATFEESLATAWGSQYAIGVGSGLDALEISLRVLGCGPGDKVLTTPLSAFASTLAILKLGAVPVFVDTDEFGLIDLDACRSVLRTRPDVRFLAPVHPCRSLEVNVKQSHKTLLLWGLLIVMFFAIWNILQPGCLLYTSRCV